MFYDISQIDCGIKRIITVWKAKYSYYDNLPINIKLFKLINEDKTHLKIIHQQASSLNFSVFSVVSSTILLFLCRWKKCDADAVFSPEEEMERFYCVPFFFDLKCNLKNLVLWQPTSHQTLINTDQHLFSAVHCSSFSKLKSKSTCSIHPVTLLWKFELKKKKKKSQILTKQGDTHTQLIR